MEPDPLLDNRFERLRVKDEVYGGPKLSTNQGMCKLYQHTLGWKHNIKSLGPAKISEVKCVASYNWVRKNRVTMLIPGAPPVWHPSHSICDNAETEGISQNDVGTTYKWLPGKSPEDVYRVVYQNDGKDGWHGHPLEPMIYAAKLMDPAFELNKFDFVIDAAAIEFMLAFIQFEPNDHNLKVELVNRTVFIASEESERYPCSYQPLVDDALTWEDCVKDSISHQRVLSYVFGGHRILIRCSTHGYLPGSTGEAAESKEGEDPVVEKENGSDAPRFGASAKGFPVAYRCGKIIPQEAIFDFKGNEKGAPRDSPSEGDIGWMWIRQVSKIMTVETGGAYNNAKVQDTTSLLRQWEDKNRSDLVQLADLLSKMRHYANESRSRGLSISRVICPKPEFMSVIESKTPRTISLAVLNYDPTSSKEPSSTNKERKECNPGTGSLPKCTIKKGKAEPEFYTAAGISKSSSLESIALTDWEFLDETECDTEWVEVESRRSKPKKLPN